MQSMLGERALTRWGNIGEGCPIRKLRGDQREVQNGLFPQRRNGRAIEWGLPAPTGPRICP